MIVLPHPRKSGFPGMAGLFVISVVEAVRHPDIVNLTMLVLWDTTESRDVLAFHMLNFHVLNEYLISPYELVRG